MPVLCCLGREERELPQVFEATQSLLLLWGAMDVSTASRVTPSALPRVLRPCRPSRFRGFSGLPSAIGPPRGPFSLSSLFTAVHVSSGLNPKARPQGHLTEAALLGDTRRCPPRPESLHSFLRINAKRPPPGCQAPFRVPGGEPWARKAPCPA